MPAERHMTHHFDFPDDSIDIIEYPYDGYEGRVEIDLDNTSSFFIHTSDPDIVLCIHGTNLFTTIQFPEKQLRLLEKAIKRFKKWRKQS